MNRQLDRQDRSYLQYFIFLGLATVVLWPEKSYFGLLRFADVPTLFASVAYLVPVAGVVASLHIGTSVDPDESSMRSLLLWELRSAVTVLSLSLPTLVLAITISRGAMHRLPFALLVLYAALLFYHALGALARTFLPMPVLRHTVAWGGGALFLHLSAVWLPAANPVIALANLIGATQDAASVIWIVRLDTFPFGEALLPPLLGAGFMTMPMIFLKKK